VDWREAARELLFARGVAAQGALAVRAFGAGRVRVDFEGGGGEGGPVSARATQGKGLAALVDGFEDLVDSYDKRKRTLKKKKKKRAKKKKKKKGGTSKK